MTDETLKLNWGASLQYAQSVEKALVTLPVGPMRDDAIVALADLSALTNLLILTILMD